MSLDVLLDEHSRAVAERVLDEEGARRRHLVVSLTGAHAFGFPSRDSDLDLKGVHVERTEALLGLAPPVAHATRFEIIEGVEIDYTSNEIGPVLVGLLGGNGSYLERILGLLPMRTTPALDELRALARGALSKRYHRHYRGFSAGMLRELESAERATAKKILYVLRTALTGAHLLATGELVTDVTQLLDEHGFGDAHALVARKRAAERLPVDDDERRAWIARLGGALARVDEALASSPLPNEPANRAEVEAWLLALRRADLNG
jgi:hypothetical protein